MKKILFLALFISFFSKILAQNTLSSVGDDAEFKAAVELFNGKQYTAAQTAFQQYISKNAQDEKNIQAEYYLAICASTLESPNALFLMNNFIEKYPNHLRAKPMYFYLGNHYFQQKDFKAAAQILEKIYDPDYLIPENLEAAYLQGNAYMELRKFDQALKIFESIKKRANIYQTNATYYCAYIYFLNKDYDKAFANIKNIENQKDADQAAQALLASIYFKKNRFVELIAYLERLKKQGKTIPATMELLLGDSYYMTEQYEKAVLHLETAFTQLKNEKDSALIYRLGYSFHQIQRNIDAIFYFKKIVVGENEWAQRANFQLAMIYLWEKDQQNAFYYFDKARKMTFVDEITEIATLNFAKLAFDIYDFKSSLNGCEMYLEKYPQGAYRSQIDSLIGDAFLNSEEYDKAISFMEKIPQKSLKMQYDYQKILYNKAVESSSQKEFPQALSFLKKSLSFPLDDSLSNNAYFWLGELYAVENQYDSANLYYQQVFKNTAEYAPALYGIAQCAYQNGKYDQAVSLFKTYLTNETNKKNKRYATALTRIGDCFFLKNDIKSALTFYNESSKQSESDLAYNMYQKAISLAALKDLKKTKPAFDSLIKQFPDFEYIDDAYYQRSAFLLENNRKKEALASFTELIQKKQESNFLPYALFQRAEIYLSQKQYADAISDYLKIVEKFPNTNSNKNAVSALFDLKNQGIAVGNIDHLFVGMNTEEKKVSENTAVNNDPLALAKLDHDKGNYASAIKILLNFIRNTPNKSIFLPQAYYLLASSYENTKKISEALKFYSLVTDGYQEDALIRIAHISLEKGNFKAAVDNYKYVLDQTSKEVNKTTALSGLIQVNFKLKNYAKCEEFAQEILDKKYTKFMDLAEMFLGKSALEQKQYAIALAYLRSSAKSYQIPIAAESQYWIGYVLRLQKDFSNSISELAEVRKRFESQRFWIDEAFLLISENYIDLGDKFHAKEVLNTLLQESKEAKIKEKVKARLAKI